MYILPARRFQRAIAGFLAIRESKRRNTGVGQVRPLTLSSHLKRGVVFLIPRLGGMYTTPLKAPYVGQ